MNQMIVVANSSPLLSPVPTYTSRTHPESLSLYNHGVSYPLYGGEGSKL